MLFPRTSQEISEGIPASFERLTALRGIAALMVAVGHSLMTFSVDSLPALWNVSFSETQGYQSFITKALLILFNGDSAVVLFFVLSGLVLGLSLDRQTCSPAARYYRFLIRRAFRIYPALIVSLLCVGALMPWLVNIEQTLSASDWFNSLYRSPFGLEDLWRNALLLDTDMNPVSWTLKIEVLIALVFPLLHAIARSTRPWCDVLIVAVLMWLSGDYGRMDLLRWAGAFYLGLVLPRWSQMCNQSGGIRLVRREAMIGIACAVFFCASSVAYVASSVAIVIGMGLLSGGESKYSRSLDAPWLRDLGQASYSFYLIHIMVLYSLARLAARFSETWVAGIGPLATNIVLAGISCGITFVLAKLIFVWVEVPFMVAGRSTAQWFMGREGMLEKYGSRA